MVFANFFRDIWNWMLIFLLTVGIRCLASDQSWKIADLGIETLLSLLLRLSQDQSVLAGRNHPKIPDLQPLYRGDLLLLLLLPIRILAFASIPESMPKRTMQTLKDLPILGIWSELALICAQVKLKLNKIEFRCGGLILNCYFQKLQVLNLVRLMVFCAFKKVG